jgi:hypothetical protein
MPDVIEVDRDDDSTGRFAVVPTWIFDQGLTFREFRVWVALCSFADKKGFCWPSIGTIASMTKIDIRHVSRALQALRERGLVEWEQRTKGNTLTSSKYQIARCAPEGTGQNGQEGTGQIGPEGTGRFGQEGTGQIGQTELTIEETREPTRGTDQGNRPPRRASRRGSLAEADAWCTQLRPDPDTQTVFDAWAATQSSPVELTNVRRRAIEYALVDHDVEDLVLAVTNWPLDGWERRKDHSDLPVLLRNASQIKRFMRMRSTAVSA